MKYYPVFLDVKERPCLVVGGGRVGTRKALGLVRANARVRVVSPEVSPELAQAAQAEELITLVKRPFENRDLEGICLVFAATDNMDLNARVRKAAANANVMCNAADGSDKGDFILPAVVEREDLLLAVSTCGASPALAKSLRQKLEQDFGPEYGKLIRLLANIRKRLLAEGHNPEQHKKQFTALVEKDLAGLIAAKENQRINQILDEVLGNGFSYEDLSA